MPGIDLSLQAQSASSAPPPVPLPDEDAICTIFLTSGSTGQPKGVMVSQRATWLRTHAGAAAYSTTGGAGEVIMFPLFHMAGWNFAMMAWSARHAAHLVRRADAEQLLGAVERWSPSVIYCIPAVWRRILESKLAVDTSSVEWALTGTSQVTQELLAGIKERFPAARTTVNYGSTETARAVGLRDPDLFTHPGSVGHPIPGVQARVAEDGELLLTSDRLMAGYFELPVETAQALQNGWYHTGDLAEQDDEGYLYIVGRKKEVIRTGGETVAPVEVETALAGYPGIADVGGRRHPRPAMGRSGLRRRRPPAGGRGPERRGFAVPHRRAFGGLQTPTPSCRSRRAPADLCDRAGAAGETGPAVRVLEGQLIRYEESFSSVGRVAPLRDVAPGFHCPQVLRAEMRTLPQGGAGGILRPHWRSKIVLPHEPRP